MKVKDLKIASIHDELQMFCVKCKQEEAENVVLNIYYDL